MPPDFPQELIESVLLKLYEDHRGRFDCPTLSACSKVCRAWNGPSQRLLFYNVHLQAATATSLLTSPVEHTKSLATSIRCLELDPTTSSKENAEAVLISVFTHCKSLYELILHVDKLHDLNTDAVEKLYQLARRPDVRPLRALRLSSFGTQSPLVYQLIHIWPTIQFLRLGQELNAPHPRFLSPLIQLYELTLFRVPTRNVTAIEWLLSNSIGHLRILHLRDEPGRAYNDLFQVHGPNLESLRLYNHSKRTSTILKMCPNLKEFAITLLSSFLPLDGLPESLEHLSFRNYEWGGNDSLFPIIHAVELLPKLRVVSCDANASQHRDWESLKRKCEQRGVELRMDAMPIYVVSTIPFEESVVKGITHCVDSWNNQSASNNILV
ncbi:hypothetical protein EIP91_004614 [Steccherinum ochraceum]|uniref:F-box domain-containing protein n=1 Tax=Steccherinum ochraceum TaxID=92696 RepID=A0A4R0S1R9_9APHY|nr:hypothetical protein EIP91_004614 [Steccherinum ochraceum]